MNSLYHLIHSHGPIADLAYRTWHAVYGAKERLRRRSELQTPRCGVYQMNSLNISTTEFCTAKCCFCLYPRLKGLKIHMPNDLFENIIVEWAKFEQRRKRLVNLTPGTPPGEALADPGFVEKLRTLQIWGYQAFFVSNATLLHKHAALIVKSGAVGAVSFSIGSLDPTIYKEVYGVDQCERVKKNILDFLDLNRAAGWPVESTICFRNCEAPSQIIAHPDYKKFKEFFGPRCYSMFTTWWDDWGGMVPHEEMERGWIRVRKPLNLNRVCEGALQFSMRPTDRNIRLCGCRMVPGQDDLVVGNLDKGFADAQRTAFAIQDDFHIGVRPKTCQSCGAYKQA